jgi:hypothetical protein
MKKIVLLLALSLGMISTSFGQQYNTAIGLKGGFPGYGALSLKHFFGQGAIEVNLGGGSRHLWIQGLYEQNYGIQEGLEWYWGLGADVAFWNNDYHWHYNDHYYHGGSRGSLDAVVGLEYTFAQVPINLAIDAGPQVRVWPYVGVGFGGALALRFAIK